MAAQGRGRRRALTLPPVPLAIRKHHLGCDFGLSACATVLVRHGLQPPVMGGGGVEALCGACVRMCMRFRLTEPSPRGAEARNLHFNEMAQIRAQQHPRSLI